jgi:hypothetical protein
MASLLKVRKDVNRVHGNRQTGGGFGSFLAGVPRG